MGSAMNAIFAAKMGVEAGQTVGDYYAERGRGRFERTAFDTNARFKRLEADDAIRRGDLAAGDVRRDAAAVRGAQRVAAAGQGVDVNSGTVAALQDETDAVGELDAQTVKNNAWREAWGLKAKADDYERQGRMATLESKNKQRNTLVTGGLNALTTATKWGEWKTERDDSKLKGRRTRSEDKRSLRRAYR